MSLPPYPCSTNLNTDSELDESQTEAPGPPTYTRSSINADTAWDIPPLQQNHVFSLVKKSLSEWLTLSVKSRATSHVDPPTFFQCGEVAGTLRLDLQQEEVIDEITIALCGRLTISSHSASNFLYILRKVYSASDRSPKSSPSFLINTRAKLHGRHDFPYSFRLPKAVGMTIIDGTTPQSCRLPPSFSDDLRYRVDVQYSLVVRVSRGGFRSGSKLVVPIKYTPIARPTAPTILRQLAYQHDSAVIGPDGDPGGWKTLDTINITGRLFSTMEVEARCILSLSRPLTYTRGCPIHLFASIDTDNDNFSDILTPASLHVALVQRVTIDEAPDFRRASRRLAPKRTAKLYERATASWWLDSSPNRTSNVSSPTHSSPVIYSPRQSRATVFAGHLDVPNDLIPACQILHYSHEYQVVLYPPSAVGFAPSVSRKAALLTESVVIVTEHAQGPRARSSVLPEYGAG